MKDLNEALEEQLKIIKGIAKDVADLRREVSSKPTRLDFLSSCLTINKLLDQAHHPPISDTILEQWGITGGEGMAELKALVEEWLSHVDARGKDEV